MIPVYVYLISSSIGRSVYVSTLISHIISDSLFNECVDQTRIYAPTRAFFFFLHRESVSKGTDSVRLLCLNVQ